MSIQIKSTAQTTQSGTKKLCIFGQSGIGKTLLACTSKPFVPLIILTERTGDETLDPSNLRKIFGKDADDIHFEMDIIEAFDIDSLAEAIEFANKSTQHDLIIFDSGSRASYLILRDKKGSNKDGRKAYAEHNDDAMELVNDLVAGDKNVVIIAHTARQEDSDTGETLYYPSFEGKAFNEKFVYEMPHVLFLDFIIDEASGEKYRALRTTQGDTNIRCKTRGGCLEELEEPHLGRLLLKLNATPQSQNPTPSKPNKFKK